MCNWLLLKLLNELQPVFEEERYAGLESPYNTEKQGICPFETVMVVPFSHLRGLCSPFLALLSLSCEIYDSQDLETHRYILGEKLISVL